MHNSEKRNQMKAAINKVASDDTLVIDGPNPAVAYDGTEGRITIELKFNWLEKKPQFVIMFNGEQCGGAFDDYDSAVRAYNETAGEGYELPV